LLDLAHCLPGKGDGGDHIPKVIADDDDAAGLHGDIRAGTHGDAEVGLGQGGGVIDAVADHGDALPLLLQPLDILGLVRREHLREHIRDTDLFGDRFCGAGVVAGDHPGLDTHFLELKYSFAAGLLDGVRHGDQAQDRFFIG
jgi:hypothetical protein